MSELQSQRTIKETPTDNSDSTNKDFTDLVEPLLEELLFDKVRLNEPLGAGLDARQETQPVEHNYIVPGHLAASDIYDPDLRSPIVGLLLVGLFFGFCAAVFAWWSGLSTISIIAVYSSVGSAAFLAAAVASAYLVEFEICKDASDQPGASYAERAGRSDSIGSGMFPGELTPDPIPKDS